MPEMHKTPEGYLTGDALVLKPGVFKYKTLEGKSVNVLKHPDNLYNAKSLETLKQVPITLDHPTGPVDANTAQQVTVGMSGEQLKLTDDGVIVNLKITDAATIEAIQNGKKELSAGFKFHEIPEDGMYEGEEYQYKQTDFNFNHIAIVDKARIGHDARLNLAFDGEDIEINIVNEEGSLMKKEDQATESQEVITKDSEDAQAIEAVKTVEPEKTEAVAVQDQAKLAGLDEDIKKIQSTIKDLTENLGAIQQKHAALAGVAESMVAGDSADVVQDTRDFDKEVDMRVGILTSATKVLPMDELKQMSNRQIMEKALGKIAPQFACDSVEDEYLRGRFDQLMSDYDQTQGIRQQMESMKVGMDSKDTSNKSFLDRMNKHFRKG